MKLLYSTKLQLLVLQLLLLVVVKQTLSNVSFLGLPSEQGLVEELLGELENSLGEHFTYVRSDRVRVFLEMFAESQCFASVLSEHSFANWHRVSPFCGSLGKALLHLRL